MKTTIFVAMAIGIAAMVTTTLVSAAAAAPQGGPPPGTIGGCVQYTIGFIHYYHGGVAGPGNSGIAYTCKNNPP
jgi:ABC-type sugar transport system substrate-binding protein